jgi:hypothetical protein
LFFWQALALLPGLGLDCNPSTFTSQVADVTGIGLPLLALEFSLNYAQDLYLFAVGEEE